jgi:hypothetical protein
MDCGLQGRKDRVRRAVGAQGIRRRVKESVVELERDLRHCSSVVRGQAWPIRQRMRPTQQPSTGAPFSRRSSIRRTANRWAGMGSAR